MDGLSVGCLVYSSLMSGDDVESAEEGFQCVPRSGACGRAVSVLRESEGQRYFSSSWIMHLTF